VDLFKQIALCVAATTFGHAGQGLAQKADRVIPITRRMCRNAMCGPNCDVAPNQMVKLAFVFCALLNRFADSTRQRNRLVVTKE